MVVIQLSKILVPTDFSVYSNNALSCGCELADRFGAELHLLHVFQDLIERAKEDGFTALIDEELQNAQATFRNGIHRKLEELPEPAGTEKTKTVRELRTGHPFVEIIRYAKENCIDLIVMGTHGRTGIPHALLGSVAEKVVRQAPCSVLTVRDAQYEFEKP